MSRFEWGLMGAREQLELFLDFKCVTGRPSDGSDMGSKCHSGVKD